MRNPAFINWSFACPSDLRPRRKEGFSSAILEFLVLFWLRQVKTAPVGKRFQGCPWSYRQRGGRGVLPWGEGKAASEETGVHSKLARGAFGTVLLKWQMMPTEEGAFEIDQCLVDLRVKFMLGDNV